MRGTKRKIEIEKRETRQQRSVACTKRRKTVFSKADDLCPVSGANIAVFVTSPDKNYDVVYTSPACEIAHCYLKGKSPPKIISNPQSKIGFRRNDPDLYRSCDDVSEIDIIEDRLERTKNKLMASLDDQNFDQDYTSTSSSHEMSIHGESSSSQVIVQNPSSSSLHGISAGSLSGFVSDDFDHTDIYCGNSSQQLASFGQNPNSPTQTEPVVNLVGGYDDDDQSFWENLVNEDVLGLNNDHLWETNQVMKNSSSMGLTQETQTELMVNLVGGYDDDKSFWENLLMKDDEFGLNNDFRLGDDDNNPPANPTNDNMIDISEFLKEAEIYLLHSDQFIA